MIQEEEKQRKREDATRKLEVDERKRRQTIDQLFEQRMKNADRMELKLVYYYYYYLFLLAWVYYC